MSKSSKDLFAYFRKMACLFKKLRNEYRQEAVALPYEEPMIRLLEVAAIERQTEILRYIAQHGIKVTVETDCDK